MIGCMMRGSQCSLPGRGAPVSVRRVRSAPPGRPCQRDGWHSPFAVNFLPFSGFPARLLNLTGASETLPL